MQNQNSNLISRMDRKKEKTRNQIIEVALKLIRSQGYSETTMEQIAEEADIAKGTLYNYFPLKEAILSAYIQQSFLKNNPDRFKEIEKYPDTRSKLVFIFNLLMDGVKPNHDIFEQYIVYRMQSMVSFQPKPEESSGIKALSQQILQSGQAAGEIRTDLDLNILMDLFEFTFIEIVKQFYKLRDTFEQNKTITSLVDLLITGIHS